uniref:Uncharacterized protein n=1 Tax=viral metagenome TaxID=1070528 RepID=A0A6M3KZ44_9ZZZZ
MLRVDPESNAVEICCSHLLATLELGAIYTMKGGEYPRVNIREGTTVFLTYCPYCGQPFNPDIHGKRAKDDHKVISRNYSGTHDQIVLMREANDLISKCFVGMTVDEAQKVLRVATSEIGKYATISNA